MLGTLNQTLQVIKQQEKALSQNQHQQMAQSSQQLLAQMKKIGNVDCLVKRVDELDGQGMRLMMDQLRSYQQPKVVVLLSIQGNKMQVLASVSPVLLGQVPSAVDLVRYFCGKGGGRDDMAQGGSAVPDDFELKLQGLESYIKETA